MFLNKFKNIFAAPAVHFHMFPHKFPEQKNIVYSIRYVQANVLRFVQVPSLNNILRFVRANVSHKTLKERVYGNSSE